MEKIKKKISDLLKVIGFKKFEIEIKKDNSFKDKELLIIDIETDDEQASEFLKENAIGLNAFQHLIRILISRQVVNQPFLIIDINRYKKNREKELEEIALKAVQKTKKTKKPVTLDPMPAYERRLVHLKLAEYSDIVTESMGEEPERKLIVRLYP